MLELRDVTLLAVDTINQALALRALAASMRSIRFARAALLTDRIPAGVDVPPGIEIVPIAPIASRDAYSQLVLKSLRREVATSHLLLVQWDGYVVHPEAWEPGFLAQDYIGAPWFWQPAGRRVGNGGFSLRSRRLLEALEDPRITLVEAEDLTICNEFRPLLEREHGIRYADEAMADRFAFEAAYPVGKPFGFHGAFNFCRTVPVAELAALAEAFSDAIAASPQIAQLLRNCVALGQWPAVVALARRRLAVLPGDAEAPAALAQAEAQMARGPVVGRNDPCPCGSGKRYKQCHGALGAPPLAGSAGRAASAGSTSGGEPAGSAAAIPAPAPSAPGPDALVAQAMARHQMGALDDAERDYRAALAAAPDHPLALHFLGVILYQRGCAADALPLLQRSIDVHPREAEFHNNLGLALADLDRYDEARAAYDRALALRPAHAGAFNNLGLARVAGNDLDGGIAAYRRAIALQPDFGQAHWNLALALLLRGDFAEAWREYEWRLTVPEFAPMVARYAGPRWRGEDVRGKTVLITAEQGLGDTLEFIRYASLVAARGATVVVHVPAPLARLVATVAGVARVVSGDGALPPYDFHSPLLSLPGVFATDFSNIPGPPPYLAADANRRAEVRAALAAQGPAALRVGLAWAGARRYAVDRRRSCPLAALAPLLELPGIQWYSLQKDEDAAELASVAAAARLVRLDARNDFDGTAALCAELDVVVSVDTSIGHLAGALDRPVFALMAFAPDWRWHLDRADSPWYPRHRLFRQARPGDWSGPVAAVADALAALSAPRAG